MIIEPLFSKPIGFVDLTEDVSNEILEFCRKDKEDAAVGRGNASSKEKYILEKPEFFSLKKFIEGKTNDFFNTIFCPSTNVCLRITQSWLNYTDKGQFHHMHNHSNSFISGVFYIDTSENDKIKFYDEPWGPFTISTNEYNHYNSTSWWYPAKKNSLILFPSSLVHGVDGFDDEHTRVSLAFNTFFEGTLGDYTRATELKL